MAWLLDIEDSAALGANVRKNVAVTAILLLWFKLVGFLRSTSRGLAAFVYMLGAIVGDLVSRGPCPKWHMPDRHYPIASASSLSFSS